METKQEVQSLMVVCNVYQLKTPISLKKGTYDENGQKVLKFKDRVLSRNYVEQRNAHQNNEIIIIDEVKTAEFIKKREKNIVEQVKKDKLDKVSNADLIKFLAADKVPEAMKEEPELSIEVDEVVAEVDEGETKTVVVEETPETEELPDLAIVNLPEGEPDNEWRIEELRAYCDINKIDYHHLAKEAKILENINEHNNQKA